MIPNTRGLYTLVSGASSGLGQAIAISLSKNRPVILHGRDIGRLNETRLQCENSGEHLIWAYDLREPAGLPESLAGLISRNGIAIDGFIHSAGMAKILPIRTVDYKALEE